MFALRPVFTLYKYSLHLRNISLSRCSHSLHVNSSIALYGPMKLCVGGSLAILLDLVLIVFYVKTWWSKHHLALYLIDYTFTVKYAKKCLCLLNRIHKYLSVCSIGVK